jgi:hypothetical protein
MVGVAWLRARYNRMRVFGRALEEAVEARAADGPAPETVTLKDPTGAWVPLPPSAGEWVAESLPWAWQHSAEVLAALGKEGYRVKRGRVAVGGRSLDLVMEHRSLEGDIIAEMTYSARPQQAEIAAREKIGKYYDLVGAAGCERVGVVGVGDHSLRVMVLGARCSDPMQIDCDWGPVNAKLHKREHDSGASKRSRGIGDVAEAKYREKHAADYNEYSQKSMAAARAR